MTDNKHSNQTDKTRFFIRAAISLVAVLGGLYSLALALEVDWSWPLGVSGIAFWSWFLLRDLSLSRTANALMASSREVQEGASGSFDESVKASQAVVAIRKEFGLRAATHPALKPLVDTVSEAFKLESAPKSLFLGLLASLSDTRWANGAKHLSTNQLWALKCTPRNELLSELFSTLVEKLIDRGATFRTVTNAGCWSKSALGTGEEQSTKRSYIRSNKYACLKRDVKIDRIMTVPDLELVRTWVNDITQDPAEAIRQAARSFSEGEHSRMASIQRHLYDLRNMLALNIQAQDDLGPKRLELGLNVVSTCPEYERHFSPVEGIAYESSNNFATWSWEKTEVALAVSYGAQIQGGVTAIAYITNPDKVAALQGKFEEISNAQSDLDYTRGEAVRKYKVRLEEILSVFKQRDPAQDPAQESGQAAPAQESGSAAFGTGVRAPGTNQDR